MASIDSEYQKSSSSQPIRFGRDEMNLIEFPFGPIRAGKSNVYQAEHVVRDRKTKKLVCRKLLITGSEAFGLPRPIDEQVLIGLKALTQEAGFESRKVFFSQYHLCKVLGWRPDGRAYRRMESSLDRIAGTTLKFKNAWWDKGDESWRSHTFHLIDNVELCSSERMQSKRRCHAGRKLPLCSFIWNEVVWKSFQDGYIRKIDMEMFRRIANGRRREVPVRLYRWLDKQFYRSKVVRIDIERLGLGTLGLGGNFSSELKRVIARASQILIECNFLEDFCFRAGKNHNGYDVLFMQRQPKRIRSVKSPALPTPSLATVPTNVNTRIG